MCPSRIATAPTEAEAVAAENRSGAGFHDALKRTEAAYRGTRSGTMLARGRSENSAGLAAESFDRAAEHYLDRGAKTLAMAEGNSGTGPGGRVAAPVKHYDAVKGYGFLAPGGGLPDIFCHASVLRKAGLDALLEGATVTCETMQGERGPQGARILAVDFSTARPVPGDGRMHADTSSAWVGRPTSGHAIRALVKWFVPAKGYGFLQPEDGSADVFCHAAVVEAAGQSALPPGAAVTCEIVQGDKGPQVSRIVDVDVADAREGGAGDVRRRGGFPGPAWAEGEAPGPSVEVRGTVKYYDPVRGFGFVVPDDGGAEVFVHRSALSRSGLNDLQPGERVGAVGSARSPGDRGAADLRMRHRG